MIYLLMALAGAGAVVLLLRRSPITYPDAKTLIIEPPVDVALERRADGDYELQWKGADEPITIYTGAAPDAIDRTLPITISTQAGKLILPRAQVKARPYFEIDFGAAGKRLVGERILPFSTIANFRDLGGYATVDGRRVRWGMVYRAGSLAYVTPEEMDYLASLGIKLICDLRTDEEVEKEPDRLPPDAKYLHLPLVAENDTVARLRTLLFNKRKLPLMLVETYTRVILDGNAALYGGILRRLAEQDNLPALIHCTAGKDRTGIAAALLLLALGVPEEVVVADYTLSNHYYDRFLTWVAGAIQPIAWLRVEPEDLKPLLLADGRAMQAALDHIRARYGSAAAYLRDAAGVDDAVIERLKASLLV